MNRQIAVRALLGAWAALLTLAIGSLMVDHLAPLPPLGNPKTIAQGLTTHLGPAQARVVHVIAAGCSCTRGLLEHLHTRGPRRDRPEILLLIGAPDAAPTLAERGFTLHTLTREELRRDLAIDGAPVLLVQAADGALTYAGGYFDVPAAIHALDEYILAELDLGRSPTPLPLFGCAVTPETVNQRDPTGIRRALDALNRFVEGVDKTL